MVVVQSMLYSKDDFFDAISRDASDRGEPRQNRFANQRKVDVEVGPTLLLPLLSRQDGDAFCDVPGHDVGSIG